MVLTIGLGLSVVHSPDHIGLEMQVRQDMDGNRKW